MGEFNPFDLINGIEEERKKRIEELLTPGRFFSFISGPSSDHCGKVFEVVHFEYPFLICYEHTSMFNKVKYNFVFYENYEVQEISKKYIELMFYNK